MCIKSFVIYALMGMIGYQRILKSLYLVLLCYISLREYIFIILIIYSANYLFLCPNPA
jgi:hypothetical protein